MARLVQVLARACSAQRLLRTEPFALNEGNSFIDYHFSATPMWDPRPSMVQ
jgi:hypothetical protein